MLLYLVIQYISVTDWSDHDNLADEAVHISKILYVRTNTTDSSLEWRVTITITEPDVASYFSFLFSIDGGEVKMKQLSPNTKTIAISDTGKVHDVYSFSVYNFKAQSHKIHLVIFRNTHTLYTAKINEKSIEQEAKSVRYSVEKLAGTSLIETKCSIINLYGGKMPYINLYGGKMPYINLYGGKMPYINLYGGKMPYINLYGGKMPYINLYGGALY